MNRRLVHMMLILLVACPFALDMASQDDAEHLFQTDTVAMGKSVQVLGLPVVFFTPETSFGGGGGLQLFFNRQRSEINSRVSNIFFTAIYTANQQLSFNVIPQLYLYQGRMYLEGDVLYRIYPNSFWGVGGDLPAENEERYNMSSLVSQLALRVQFPPSLSFGFEYQFSNHVMLETVEGGLLDEGNIPGSEGAIVSGLSFVLDYDNRDNVYSAVGGTYLTFKGGFSAQSFGATYAYNEYLIDLRKYFTLAGKHTLAIQGYIEANSGIVPFQELAWLGGPERNRGFFKGRYMDKNYLLLQTEFRWRLLKRLNFNVFGSLGYVDEKVPQIFSDPHYSGGVGLRFQMLKSNPTLIRMDLGINQYGETGVYFGVNEAF